MSQARELAPTYRNQECRHKHRCLNFFHDAYSSKELGPVMGLFMPAMSFKLERRLMLEFGGEFVFAEKVHSVYRNQLDFIEDNKIKSISDCVIIHTPLDVLSIRLDKRFNAIFLDFCGMFKKDLFLKLIEFIRNNTFAEHGVIAITLFLCRENTKVQSFYKQIAESLDSFYLTLSYFKEYQLPRILEKTFKEINKDLKFVNKDYYSSTSSDGKGLMGTLFFTW